VDKPRVDKSRWSTTASSDEWAKVIQRFRALSDLRDPAGRRRAIRACRLLKSEAEALYSAANELEREGREDLSPTKYQADRIARRVIKDGRLAEDAIAEEYLTRWAAKRPTIAGVPEELRALGHDAWLFADALSLGPKNFLEWGRAQRDGERGALPSIAADYLIAYAIRWGATQREIAERLCDAEVMPPPARADNREDDPISRWMTILRSAWPTAKKRQTPK
jgi:hypothetical protein